jgi:hypothetical protein
VFAEASSEKPSLVDSRLDLDDEDALELGLIEDHDWLVYSRAVDGRPARLSALAGLFV